MQKPNKEHQDRTTKEQKIPINRMDEPFLLAPNKARESLKNIEGWQLTDDHKMIYREFILHHFQDAIDMIDRIALVAEDEKHHPDIHLTQYRNLRIGLTTHDLGGLSDKDFIVACKINDLSPGKAVAINRQLQNKERVRAKPRQGIQTKKSSNRVNHSIKKV
jgi:4a-hydroxytetrahydrobiopterin dehydratase